MATKTSLVNEKVEFMENRRGVHLMNPMNGEYTICGDAFDGHDEDLSPLKATKKNRVTCRGCLRVIRDVRTYLNQTKGE